MAWSSTHERRQLVRGLCSLRDLPPLLLHGRCLANLTDTRAVQPVATCRHISISQLYLPLWRHAHYDVSRTPRSHYDVILIVMSFATELATPTVADVRTYGRLTAFNIIKMFCISAVSGTFCKVITSGISRSFQSGLRAWQRIDRLPVKGRYALPVHTARTSHP